MKKNLPSLLGAVLVVGAATVLLYFYWVANMKTPLFLNEDFVKSENEKRIHYSYFLPNGLQVLLVSDPTSKKAAASQIGRAHV